MATFNVAYIREQGVNFAVVSVQDHVVSNQTQARNVIASFEHQFGVPTVLVGARQHRLIGRPDLVRFLSRVSLSRLPWRRMTLSA